MTKKPHIFVFEGLDGSGKETISKKFEEYLTAKGYRVLRVSFPMYDRWHSFLVRWFLKGKFGKSPYSVSPKIASFFYSFDRIIGYYTKILSKIHYAEDLQLDYDFIIFDRYTTSNMLYQGAKGKTLEEQLKICKFIEFVEYKLFRLPKPDYVITLITDPKHSRKDIINRGEMDINERDLSYQERVEKFMHTLINLNNWSPVAVRNYEPPHEWFPPQDIVESIYEAWELSEEYKRDKKKDRV
jgi:Thymidylate kinase